jgi:hypothetical protein
MFCGAGGEMVVAPGFFGVLRFARLRATFCKLFACRVLTAFCAHAQQPKNRFFDAKLKIPQEMRVVLSPRLFSAWAKLETNCQTTDAHRADR